MVSKILLSCSAVKPRRSSLEQAKSWVQNGSIKYVHLIRSHGSYITILQVKQRFLERAKTSKFDWDDEMDADEATCPNCGDCASSHSLRAPFFQGILMTFLVFVNDSGRVLGCGHEICFGECSRNPERDTHLMFYQPDCSLDLSNAPPAHDGILYVRAVDLLRPSSSVSCTAAKVTSRRTSGLRKTSKLQ